MIDHRRLRDVANAATQGDWQVIEAELPCRLGRPHIERRIFTAKDHPQLKAPFPVVNGSVALGTDETPVHHMVSMTAEDAAYIAAFDPPTVLALLDDCETLIGPHDVLAEDLIKQLVDHAQSLPVTAEGDMAEFTIVCLASAERIRRQESKVGQLSAEIDTLTGAAESIRDEWRKASEAYRLLSFCHGQGTLELVQSHHELCAEIRRLKILVGEPVPTTPEEFVGPSPEGPTARIRRKIAASVLGDNAKALNAAMGIGEK